MRGKSSLVAVFPGTFDPITNGHLDVIERGRHLFERLIVAVGINPGKDTLFTQDERVAMILDLVRDRKMENVEVEAFRGLTVQYVNEKGAIAILRGIRDTADLRNEFQLALTNRAVAEVETVFMLTSEENALTSSSLIRQVAELGGDVSRLVPKAVALQLQERLRR